MHAYPWSATDPAKYHGHVIALRKAHIVVQTFN